MIHWLGKYGGRLALALVFLIGLSVPAQADKGPGSGSDRKLDKILNGRVDKSGTSRVIVMLKPGGGAAASAEIKKLGGKLGRKLASINGQVAELSNKELRKLAKHPAVASIHHDRPIGAEMNRAAVTVGARAVQAQMGYRGAGVGVAVIDSGIASWHNDLTRLGVSSLVQSNNGQRVARFVDFVGGQTAPYDDHGHGTHVSGIIAGNGLDSLGARAGVAPSAHIVSLKVLDGQGRGVVSNVIAALDYVVAHRAAHNIRVVNLSVGAAVTESFWTDPLTLAAKRAVDAGVVVVTAAGNLGRNRAGETQYGGITAPGNAPWVLTVGASNHNGTVLRYDDTIAGYSSRGPSAIDHQAKPDLVAPGTSIVSLSAVGSLLYTTKTTSLLKGLGWSSSLPYLSLSGTSMAAPVVAGTVALMMEANPALTPNLAKAILQYTAEKHSTYNELTQGAGFLNTEGAVRLARFFAHAKPGAVYPSSPAWSRTLLWGNYAVAGGVLAPEANAWATSVNWGATELCTPGDPECENIVWGTECDLSADPLCENIVWGTFDTIVCDPSVDPTCENIVWGTADCEPTNPECDNLVWGSNVVWGPLCGGDDCENLVWGSSLERVECDPAVDPACENIVWGTALELLEQCLGSGGSDCENIVWGTAADCDPSLDPECENLVWGSSAGEGDVLFDDPASDPISFDSTPFDQLFRAPSTDTSSTTAPPPAPDSSTTSITSDTVTVSGIQGGGL